MTRTAMMGLASEADVAVIGAGACRMLKTLPC
jgi:hypothetical protein